MSAAPTEPTANAERERLLAINADQKAYYESRFSAAGGAEPAASWVTNLWTRARRIVQRYEERIGIRPAVDELHRDWLGDLSSSRVLDFGCFAGNPLSLWLAERSSSYVGVDLSEQATATLAAKLDALGLDQATAVAADILDPEIDWGIFDVVYARGVLHHFQDPAFIGARLAELLRPGGMVIGLDPMQTDPVNAVARRAYRPFQSDRDWEWPLTARSFDAFEQHFAIDRIQGFRGFSKLGLPFAMVPGLDALALAIGGWGWRVDQRLASRRRLAFRLCWNVTYRMVKTDR